MPEGPETRRMADSISKALVGKKIESYQFHHDNLNKSTIGSFSHLDKVFSLGKALICRLNNGKSIISHNQLYGKWTINLRKTVPNTGRALRIEFNTKSRSVRLWSATDIKVFDSEDENNHPYLKKLGPDILMEDTDYENILVRLKSKRFRNRALAGLLLDQSFIAGLGNYLRSEILFFSKLMYFAKPINLSEKQLIEISKNIKDVSMRAYFQKGKTLNLNQLKADFGNVKNFRRIRHMVFARIGEPCLVCGNFIKRERVANRRIDFCGQCQNNSSSDK